MNVYQAYLYGRSLPEDEAATDEELRDAPRRAQAVAAEMRSSGVPMDVVAAYLIGIRDRGRPRKSRREVLAALPEARRVFAS